MKVSSSVAKGDSKLVRLPRKILEIVLRLATKRTQFSHVVFSPTVCATSYVRTYVCAGKIFLFGQGSNPCVKAGIRGCPTLISVWRWPHSYLCPKIEPKIINSGRAQQSNYSSRTVFRFTRQTMVPSSNGRAERAPRRLCTGGWYTALYSGACWPAAQAKSLRCVRAVL